MIGVLALQGDFAEHIAVLKRMNVPAIEVKRPEQLHDVDGLIIPGGESTVINRLMRINGIDKELQRKVRQGFPVFGTCAGAILLANHIIGNGLSTENVGLKLLNVTAYRNAYGRQLESFETPLNVEGFSSRVPAVFIRAPVLKAHDGVNVLAEFEGNPVLVRQDNILASTFHPELTKDTRIHQYFLEVVREFKKS